MSTDDFSVDPAITRIADRLDAVADTVREYTAMEPARWPDSMVARERAQEQEYAAIPRQHPVMDTTLFPLQCLGSSQDHLTAIAAAIRTPQTIMACFTLLRTQLVGAAKAAYLGDANIDLDRRVQRWVNAHLESLTEQMHLVGPGDAQRDELNEQRKEMVAGARKLGWFAASPSPDARWAKEWYVVAAPPTELALVDRVIPSADKPRLGTTLYRLLSATSHVQPHGVLAFIDRSTVVRAEDGSATVEVGMSGYQLVSLAMAATGALTMAMHECCRYYGWPPGLWNRDVAPILDDFRRTVLARPAPN